MANKNRHSSLTPDSVYYGPNGNAEYHTDKHGRVVSWNAFVTDIKEPRNEDAQRTLEGKNPDQQTAGHLLASSQGGSGEKYNMTPQNYYVNTRDYAAFEKENATLYSQGYTVQLRGSNSYFPTDENIPDAYMVSRDVYEGDTFLYTDHFSWTNTDMEEFEGLGDEETASLMDEFPNPGATIYDEENDIVVNQETGAVIDLEGPEIKDVGDFTEDYHGRSSDFTETSTISNSSSVSGSSSSNSPSEANSNSGISDDPGLEL